MVCKLLKMVRLPFLQDLHILPAHGAEVPDDPRFISGLYMIDVDQQISIHVRLLEVPLELHRRKVAAHAGKGVIGIRERGVHDEGLEVFCR